MNQTDLADTTDGDTVFNHQKKRPAHGPEWLTNALKSLEKRLQIPNHHRRIGSGDHATIRRQATDYPPAFWRLYFAQDDEGRRVLRLSAEATNAEIEHAWALIMQGMALMDGFPHRSGRNFGVALAGQNQDETEYSEQRFVRLLRAEGPGLVREVRAACTWLKQHGRAVDWTDPASLILSNVRAFGIDRDKVARRMAHDYFNALSRKARAQS